MRYLALDFETSGTDKDRHAPVTLGVALMEDGEVLDSIEYLFAPPRHWKTKEITRAYEIGALEVSKVTWKRILTEGLECSYVCKSLGKWASDRGADELAIVAYNAPFDLGFYSTMLFLGGDWDPNTRGKWLTATPPLFGPWQCAMMLMKRAANLDDYKLDTAAAHFGLARSGEAHGALEDAVLAGQIYHRLVGAVAVG